MTLDEILQNRRSVRQFKADPVPPEALHAIAQAGRLAPSGKNVENRHIGVVTNRALIERLQEAAYGQKQVGSAPACLVVWAENERIMDCGRSAATVDGAIAMSFMMLKATELGLDGCWLGHFKADRVKEILGLPPEAVVVVMSPLGYAARRPKPTKRRPLEEIWQIWE